MSNFKSYLERIKNEKIFTEASEDRSFQPGDVVYYNGKQKTVKSDEGDHLILNDVDGTVPKSEVKCQKNKMPPGRGRNQKNTSM